MLLLQQDRGSHCYFQAVVPCLIHAAVLFLGCSSLFSTYSSIISRLWLLAKSTLLFYFQAVFPCLMHTFFHTEVLSLIDSAVFISRLWFPALCTLFFYTEVLGLIHTAVFFACYGSCLIHHPLWLIWMHIWPVIRRLRDQSCWVWQHFFMEIFIMKYFLR